jgi:hypothetical protein
LEPPPAASESSESQVKAAASTTDSAAPLMVEPLATSKGVESSSCVQQQDSEKAVTEPATLPLANAVPTTDAAMVASPHSEAKAGLGSADNPVALTIEPSAASKGAEPSFCVQQDVGNSVSDPVALPLATVALVIPGPTLAASESSESQVKGGASTTHSAAPLMVGQLATSKAVEFPPYMQQGVGKMVSEPATLPLVTAKPVTPMAPAVAVELPKSQPKARLGTTDSAVFYVVEQLAINKAGEFSSYVQPGLGRTVSDPVGLSRSLATAAFLTLSTPPVAAQSPKPQAKAGSSAADSALLWMVQQLDASKTALESSIGSLHRKRWSGLIPDVATSVFAETDDWMVDAVLK